MPRLALPADWMSGVQIGWSSIKWRVATSCIVRRAPNQLQQRNDVSVCCDDSQVLEARPDMAGWTGVFDRSSAMHRAAAGGHLGVLRAIVESLRAYGAGVTDPSKGDHKVRSKSAACMAAHVASAPSTGAAVLGGHSAV